jgi:hypothetical protein
VSRYEVNLIIDVDDEALATHDGDKEPPPNDPEEWYFTDLVRALDYEFASVENAPLDIWPYRP